MRRFKVWFSCIILSLVIFQNHLPAREKTSGSGVNMRISQQRFEKAGLLISRPDPLDEEIMHLLTFNKIITPRDYAGWLSKNLKYRADEKTDSWSDPIDTLKTKGGDCEDLAFLHKAVLKALGFEPEVLALLRLFKSHAICVFKDEDCYYLIDNTSLKKTKAKSISQLARYLFLNYNCASIAKADFQRKDWQVLFKKSNFYF
ncbi:MAG: transglutaminase domain-containing protein [Candidatus Omnitrophica bacterium]|nr:transglutaminase domain-containing protein [Candidatus Omnitrophota bacterium]